MKGLLTIILLVFFNCKAYTQRHPSTDSLLGLKMLNPEEPHLPISQVKNHVGKDVYIYDVVSGRREINDTLALLYVGQKYPKHLLIIIVKGKVAKTLGTRDIGKQLHFSGIVSLYEGKPAITVTNYYQLGERIQL